MQKIFFSVFIAIFLGGESFLLAAEPMGPSFSEPATVLEMDKEWSTGEVSNKNADLSVSLNLQFFPILKPLIDAYAEKNNLQIIIQKGTCGISSSLLSEKRIDIGSLCCPPGNIDRLPGLQFYTLAIHPVAILVRPDNPVTNVDFFTLQQIFRGHIRRWSDIGGFDRPIIPITRLHCKKRPGHWKNLLANEDLFSFFSRRVGAIDDVFDLIATTSTAIGFEVFWPQIMGTKKVKVLTIDGMSPFDRHQLREGRYPLYRTIVLASWRHNPTSRQLINFLRQQMESLATTYNFVPFRQLRAAGWRFVDQELTGPPIIP